MSWFDKAGGGQPCDVEAMLDGVGVTVLVARIVKAGALVSIGTTSDGGALGVTVTLDGAWRREYFRDAEPMVHWLEEAADGVEAEDRPSAASSGRRRRQRGA